EGEQNAQWVLMDYGDVIIHIFYEDVRKFYDLEGLWVDAPRLEAKDLDQSTSLDKA
ncbi:MAG: ribosome silencing factor, partial [Deltaproteobacteria bacterium CG_4_9_14_3_um_filter_51_14]